MELSIRVRFPIVPQDQKSATTMLQIFASMGDVKEANCFASGRNRKVQACLKDSRAGVESTYERSELVTRDRFPIVPQ